MAQRRHLLPEDACEQEKIRSPGMIQPHKGLIIADADTLGILSRSRNIAQFVEIGATAARLPDLLQAIDPAQNSELLCERAQRDAGIDLYSPPLPLAPNGLWTTLRQHGSHLMVEFEAITDADVAAFRLQPALAPILADIGRTEDTRQLCAIVARHVRALTGFERVIIYRFGPEGHGDVMAESLEADSYEPLFGFHFPASDIPRQARDLYRSSRSRFTPTRDYGPVPLDPPSDERQGGVFDLSHVASRSLSPAHLDYQRNLGVDGAMSLSLTDGETLWGLVVGHHRMPHRVTLPARGVSEILAHTLSLRLLHLEEQDRQQTRLRFLAIHNRFLQQIAAGRGFIEPLLQGPTHLTELFPAVTGAAVVSAQGRVAVIGRTPDQPFLIELARRCRTQLGDGVFVTDRLVTLWPEAERWIDIAAGLLAISLDDEDQHLILWLRPEEPVTTIWAGASPDQVDKIKQTGNISPRDSFKRWVTEHRGASAAWPTSTLQDAHSLRSTINKVILRQNQVITALNQRAEALTAANDRLSRVTAELQTNNKRMRADLKTARDMQLSLLPKKPALDARLKALDLSLDSLFEPTADIGGDLWGIIEAGPHRLGLFSLDFSGHGVGAALNVFRLCSLLAEATLAVHEPAEILTRLNNVLFEALPSGQYSTMIIIVIDVQDNSLTWSAAGAPPPLLSTPDGERRWLDSRGAPLGLTPSPSYQRHYSPFPPGASLFMASDALSEATRSDQTAIGPEGVLDMLQLCETGGGLPDLWHHLARSGCLPLKDDLTALLITRH